MTSKYENHKKSSPSVSFDLNNIINFKEGQWETWVKAWIRMKMMVEMNKGLDTRDYIINYYHGLSVPCQVDLDEECGGEFLKFSSHQAFTFLEKVTQFRPEDTYETDLEQDDDYDLESLDIGELGEDEEHTIDETIRIEPIPVTSLKRENFELAEELDQVISNTSPISFSTNCLLSSVAEVQVETVSQDISLEDFLKEFMEPGDILSKMIAADSGLCQPTLMEDFSRDVELEKTQGTETLHEYINSGLQDLIICSNLVEISNNNFPLPCSTDLPSYKIFEYDKNLCSGLVDKFYPDQMSCLWEL